VHGGAEGEARHGQGRQWNDKKKKEYQKMMTPEKKNDGKKKMKKKKKKSVTQHKKDEKKKRKKRPLHEPPRPLFKIINLKSPCIYTQVP
jgi:hypothetical protein